MHPFEHLFVRVPTTLVFYVGLFYWAAQREERNTSCEVDVTVMSLLLLLSFSSFSEVIVPSYVVIPPRCFPYHLLVPHVLNHEHHQMLCILS